MSQTVLHNVTSVKVCEPKSWTREETGVRDYQSQDVIITRSVYAKDPRTGKFTDVQVEESIEIFTEDTVSVNATFPTGNRPICTVADIEPGCLYEIPGYDDNGCWLEDRGRVYVTNVIPEGYMVIVEGVWFNAEYRHTGEQHGRDGEFRAPALLPNRAAIRI